MKGVSKGAIKSADVKAAKDNLRKNPSDNIMDYIKCVAWRFFSHVDSKDVRD